MKAEDINKGVKLQSTGDNNTEILQSVPLKITNATAVNGGDKNYSHPLIKSSSDGVFLYVQAKIAEKPHMGQAVEFVGNLLTRKGKIACYPGNEDIKPALLWEIKEAIKNHSEDQLSDNWMEDWKPSTFEGLIMNFDIKYINSKGGEYYIPMTAYQREKDAKYRAEQQTKQDNTGSFSDAFGSNDNQNDDDVINPEDLPF